MSQDGYTVPFIYRYRRNQYNILIFIFRVNGAEPEMIREIISQYDTQKSLEDDKVKFSQCLADEDILTQELTQAISDCKDEEDLTQLKTLYKPKKLTKAKIAIKYGLSDLVERLSNNTITLDEYHSQIDAIQKKNYLLKSDIENSLVDLLSTTIFQNKEIKEEILPIVESNLRYETKLTATAKKDEKLKQKYIHYNEFNKLAVSLKPIEFLAIKRGCKEKSLTLHQILEEKAQNYIQNRIKQIYFKNGYLIPLYSSIISNSIEISWKDHLKTSLLKTIEKKLKKESLEKSLFIFNRNLKQLLMLPPYTNTNIIMGIDPGYSHGCKCCIINNCGDVIDLFIFNLNKDKCEDIINGKIMIYKVDVLFIIYYFFIVNCTW